MMNLKLNTAHGEEFAEKAEKSADSLRRTLIIIEGVSAPKTVEMSVEKTIEVCRKYTRSEEVRAVLEAATFSSPK